MMKFGDAAFLLFEKPTSGMQVSMLTRWSPPPGAGDDFVGSLVEQWRTRRNFAEPFNLRVRPGVLPDWEKLADGDIDLDYHFRHSALPKPGGERELGRLASRLHSTNLDRNRPLWELHIIEGLENDEFAMLIKLHHAQVDGMGGAKMLERALSHSPDTRDMPAFWEVGPEPVDEPTDASSKAGLPKPPVLKRIAGAGGLAKALMDLQLNGEKDNASAFEAPKTAINAPLKTPRRIATQCFEEARLARIAKELGVTMNDVVLGISAGALRTYLIENAELPEKSMTAGIPVSIRDDDSSGNAISFIIAKIHTEIADPIERIRAINRSTTFAKSRFKHLSGRMTQELFGSLVMAPHFALAAMNLGGRGAPVFNLIISNVPGGKEPLYLNGARMEVFYPVSAVSDGLALNITFWSYAGRYGVGFTGDRESVPHMQQIAVAAGAALEELEDAVAASGTV